MHHTFSTHLALRRNSAPSGMRMILPQEWCGLFFHFWAFALAEHYSAFVRKNAQPMIPSDVHHHHRMDGFCYLCDSNVCPRCWRTGRCGTVLSPSVKISLEISLATTGRAFNCRWAPGEGGVGGQSWQIIYSVISYNLYIRCEPPFSPFSSELYNLRHFQAKMGFRITKRPPSRTGDTYRF